MPGPADSAAAIQGTDGNIIFGKAPFAADAVELTLVVNSNRTIPVHGAFPVCDSSQQIQHLRGVFRVPVPDITHRQEVSAELHQAGLAIDRKRLILMPILHANGIDAGEMLLLHKFPLAAPYGIAMQHGFLELTGLVLAPDGNPARVSVLVDDSEKDFTFRYPLPSALARQTYWYWPNSDYATFKLSIDLCARKPSSSPAFKVQFLLDAPDSACYVEKNTFYIPKSMSRYETYPSLDRMRRVQHFESASGVAVRGYSDCMRITMLARRFQFDTTNLRILDWGCGHGRVVRHMRSILPKAQLSGLDIDPDNIGWAQQNLDTIDFRVGPLVPPTDYPDASFDVIYGISVMTHLSRDMQIAWLRELSRILAPGGLAMLTFAGDTAVAFASRYLDPEWLDEYRSRGVGRDLPSTDLAGVIDNPSYYKNVKISTQQMAQLCGEFFEVLNVLDCMFGYQDLAVLRRVD